MPHAFNLNFIEYKFAILCLHAKEDNVGKQKQHKMYGWTISSVRMN